MVRSIHDLLSAQTREHLLAILDYFRMPLGHPGNKRQIVRELGRFLIDAPEVWLDRLSEQDLRILQTLVRRGPDVQVRFAQPDYISVVEILQIVEATPPEDGFLYLSLPLPFYLIIRSRIDGIIARKEADGSFEIERLIFGYVNIYGVVPLSTFVDLLFRGVKSEEKARELTGRVADCPLIGLFQEEYKGEFYLVSPFVEDFEEILEMRRISFKSLRKYAPVRRELALQAGLNAPFCAYGMDTPEGVNLTQMLISLGYEGDELIQTVHDIWLDAQYALDEEATEALFSPVTSRQDDIRSFTLYQDCINTIVEYANSVPKWLLKGRSSNEADQMRLSIRIGDLADGYNSDPGLELYKLGLAVKPVDPDDPCPCGSGLSYRFCHGKYIS